MTRETIERRTQRAEQPQRRRHRADAPPARDPKILGDVVATALALVAVLYALVLGWFLPLGTSALVFAATAGPTWLFWPGIVATFAGGAR